MVGHQRRKAPEMQPWLARIDGEAVGMFSSMPGVDGIGLVEDLFVAQTARGQGIAQALIAHATADARARGAGPVIIGSLPDDWPKAALRPPGVPARVRRAAAGTSTSPRRPSLEPGRDAARACVTDRAVKLWWRELNGRTEPDPDPGRHRPGRSS